jgi:hypothetical protein
MARIDWVQRRLENWARWHATAEAAAWASRRRPCS